jgi:type VI secretion system protein ImpM
MAPSFLEKWDEWLQLAVASSREHIGEGWLDIYLTAPIWQFAVAAGAVDNASWVGITVPSVDSVGRYFPLTIASKIASQQSLGAAFFQSTAWFEAIEDIALATLSEGLDADALYQRLCHESLELSPANKIAAADFSPGLRLSGPSLSPEQGAAAMLEHYLEQDNHNGSYSLWRSSGSDNVEPTVAITSGLPEPRQFSAMLSGKWQE